ncbi:MAG TPA: dynamin family protein [Chthoniobacterales bacterium]|jgi:ribosome biogenesis GTPase A|nr:dynamin family protein [Chthoniobacterales bacterium]
MSQLDQLQPEPGAENRDGTRGILSPELRRQFETLRSLLQRALWLAERCADVEATQILRSRLTNLQSAALLVIVGEVKAGKSSFINALLREDVCEVAPGPCTVRIQELVYGPERRVEALGESWQRIALPKEVLREITMVDTPGTNSIVKDHQTITENYIPQSDLVVFVFSAVNPHTKSAWELLTLINKQWHRKVVFVLQQSDRATQKELTTNLEHVRQYARDRQVDSPSVFILSAKREMEGIPENAFAEFRNFLQNTIACGESWRMKVEQSYQTIRSVMTRLLAHLRTEKTAVDDERAFYQGLLCQVDVREEKARGLKVLIVDKLAATYDSLARQSEDEFARGLRVGKLFRRALPFLRDRDTEAWLRDLKSGFEKSARKEIKAEAAQVSMDLFNEMRMMMEELNHSIARRQERIRADVTFPKAADQIGTLQGLQKKMEGIRIDENILRGKVEETRDVRKLAVAGSLLAALGAVIAALSPILWLDVTGGVFLGTGIFLIAVGLFWRRNTVMKDFKERLGDSQQHFRDRLETEFGEIFDGLFYEVRQALTESLFRLDLQASFNAPLLEETFQIGEAASDMVIVSQRMRITQSPEQPSVAA